jgi:hypothetical protein
MLNIMEENNLNNTFEEISIFNNIKIKNYLSEDFGDQGSRIFICGKMYEHSFQAKYSFKACEFLIYSPYNNKLYFTENISRDCFTDSLKWNFNFFKKIRLCLETSETIKDTYFSINHEKNEKSSRIEVELNKFEDEDILITLKTKFIYNYILKLISRISLR